MTLKFIMLAAVALSVFAAIWFLLVVPAEKRDHQRRMDLMQKKLERHAAQQETAGLVEKDDSERNKQ